MGVDLYSPRISFSHDLNNCDTIPTEQHIPLKSSLLDYDFDFCVSKRNYDQNSTLADELFANGVILPTQIKRKNIPTISKPKSSSSSLCLLPPLPPSSAQTIFEAEISKETEQKQRNDDSNSFWKFKRSKSFSCGRIYRRGLCSLPLLSRSKSTGSNNTSSAKKSLIPKDEHYYLYQHYQKMTSLKNSSSTHNQKPPLKKYNSGHLQVNPVINVTTGSLFGFCSVFSNGKDKGKKK